MTEFYGLPNDGAFWHWPTLVHFVLVALAGGIALLAGVRALRPAPQARTLPLTAAVLVLADLVVLWGESIARWRLTHVYLFLHVRPGSAIWWGSWGLAASLVLAVLLALRLGPRRLWGAALLVSASVALLYPGLLLAANAARPLWSPLLLAFVPVTSVLIAFGVALAFRQRDLRGVVGALALAGAVLGALYPLALAVSGEASRFGLEHFWSEGGPLYLVGLALMGGSLALLRRAPALAGLTAVAGAVLARSLIVELGSYMPQLALLFRGGA